MFDEDMKFDGFTMKQWNRALYDFCNGPSIFDAPGNDNKIRGQMIFLMRQYAEQERLKAEKEGKITVPESPAVLPKSEKNSVLLSVEAQLKSWHNFYKKFGIMLDISKVAVPKHQKGSNRLIVLAPKMRPQLALNICNMLFECEDYSHDVLDRLVIKEDRNTSKGAYAIWINEKDGADADLNNLSAEDLYKIKIVCMGLMERLIFEAKYVDETANHFDSEYFTLCIGSRARGGNGGFYVPKISWIRKRAFLMIHWCAFSVHGKFLRARRVVA